MIAFDPLIYRLIRLAVADGSMFLFGCLGWTCLGMLAVNDSMYYVGSWKGMLGNWPATDAWIGSIQFVRGVPGNSVALYPWDYVVVLIQWANQSDTYAMNLVRCLTSH
jgi:hypothetical protein